MAKLDEIQLNIEIDVELRKELEKVIHERDCYRAFLEGLEARNIDEIVKPGTMGVIVAKRTGELILKRIIDKLDAIETIIKGV